MWAAILLLLNLVFLFEAKTLNYSPRVVGGQDANLGQFKFTAFITFYDEFWCSASIISDRYILTAAHCIDIQRAKETTVVVGTVSKLSREFEYKAKTLIPHELYGKVGGHDIGLIELEVPIDFSNENIAPIDLDETFYDGPRTLTLVAWGDTKTSEDDRLQYLRAKTISLEECKERYKSVVDSELCTKNPFGEGICSGDSGGPLVEDSKVVGVVSRGAICALGQPDIYTRVSSHIDWIRSHMN